MDIKPLTKEQEQGIKAAKEELKRLCKEVLQDAKNKELEKKIKKPKS